MSKADPAILAAVRGLIDDALTQTAPRPLVLGLCGAQGSGKSTLAAALADDLGGDGLACAVLSLDDLYLTRAERLQLARDVHPLLATRGPPGTHDIAMGCCVLDALKLGTPVHLPRFDKASDDRVQAESWPGVQERCDVVLFEGWCVGAKPQPLSALCEPVNALERRDDAGGQWRRYVNAALAGPYQRLFARIDRLVFLHPPGFSVVRQWRDEQEARLRQDSPSQGAVMSPRALGRFVQHYERLTRHMMDEMPGRADLVAWLAQDRHPHRIVRRR